MLEATQTASGEIVFKESTRWEGQVVNGKYPLRQCIGCTDHSAVFLTELPGENPRKAAVKLIAADLPNSDVQLGRLKFAAKLKHPHVLEIYEVGKCELGDHQLLFIAMEYADETLAQILPQRPLTSQETRELLTPTLETLTFIHGNGFAHGHLKPANILVTGEQIKLSGDGLCRPGAPISGRPSPYDPPEAANEGLTPAGDVWSLGQTLVETLTQHLPTWTDRLRTEPAVPDKTPEPFAEIAKHCLVRDPRSRWKISEIANRLSTPSSATREQPKTKTMVEAARPQKGTSNWLYAIPVAAMIGIIVLLAGLMRHKSTEPATTPVKTTQSARAVPRTPVRPEAATAKPSAGDAKQVIRQVVPDVPEKALRTITGRLKVAVRTHVGESGNVERAEFASAGPSRYFSNLAMQSAREWTFAPSQTAKTWLLQFTFTRNGVTVQPKQIG